MNWLTDPPPNYWLLGYLIVGLLGIWFVMALFGTDYVQTGLPTWYRRVMSAYVFPLNRLGVWLENREAPSWVRSAVSGLSWLNLFVNLTPVALPIVRVLMKSWRAVQTLF